MITVAPWGRLGNGELFARARYVAWAVMMKRSWGFDVLTCPRCSGKLRALDGARQPCSSVDAARALVYPSWS